jgi:hypothetical protein
MADDIVFKIGAEANEDDNSPEKKKFLQAKASLNIRRTLDGNLIIFDHKYIDIAIIPKTNKIMAFPKEEMGELIYATQDRLFKYLAKHGVIVGDSIQGGNVYSSIEAAYPETASEVDAIQIIVFTIAKFIEEDSIGMDFEDEYLEDLDNFFTNPDEEDSTSLGEIPQNVSKGSIRPSLRPYGMSTMYKVYEQRIKDRAKRLRLLKEQQKNK